MNLTISIRACITRITDTNLGINLIIEIQLECVFSVGNSFGLVADLGVESEALFRQVELRSGCRRQVGNIDGEHDDVLKKE